MATGIEHPRDLPTPDVVDEPHPALDSAIGSTVPRESGLDKVVFGVTALVSLAFLAWGFVSTGSIGLHTREYMVKVVQTFNARIQTIRPQPPGGCNHHPGALFAHALAHHF